MKLMRGKWLDVSVRLHSWKFSATRFKEELEDKKPKESEKSAYSFCWGLRDTEVNDVCESQ